jgi:hypothetical protein
MNASHGNDGREAVADDVSRRAVLRGIGGFAAVAAVAVARQTAVAAPESAIAREILMAQTGVAALTGSWTYRSFVNNPTAGVAFNSLRFGEAELVIDAFEPGDFTGRLILGPGAEMALVGASSLGNPFTVRFQGRGATPGVEDLVYDYVGYLAPVWPNGVDQRPAIVGSIVRTEPHSGGAEPGFVASWIAVKRDET